MSHWAVKNELWVPDNVLNITREDRKGLGDHGLKINGLI